MYIIRCLNTKKNLICNKNEIELLSEQKILIQIFIYRFYRIKRKQWKQQRQTTYIPIWAFRSSNLMITVIIFWLIINNGKYQFPHLLVKSNWVWFVFKWWIFHKKYHTCRECIITLRLVRLIQIWRISFIRIGICCRFLITTKLTRLQCT